MTQEESGCRSRARARSTGSAGDRIERTCLGPGAQDYVHTGVRGIRAARPRSLRAYRWTKTAWLASADRDRPILVCGGLWNERDPILKERLFGFDWQRGQSLEDVKECYF